MAAIANNIKVKSVPDLRLNWGGPCDISVSTARRSLWATEVFQEIEEMVGKARARSYLETYVNRLDGLGDKLSRSEVAVSVIREDAHNLQSMSGQLGFEAFFMLSAWMMAQPDPQIMRSKMEAWVGLIRASSDAARAYILQGSGGLC